MPTTKTETIKYLTPTEVTKFMSKIKDKRDLALFSLMYYYGLRAIEASNLTLSDVRLEDNRIYIKAAKNGISGEYFLTKEAKKNLTIYLKIRNQKQVVSSAARIHSERPMGHDGADALFLSRKLGHLTTTQIRRLYYKYAEKAGLDESKSHPHCLRHSIAVHMADSGTPVEHVQIHLRHRSIDSTMVYFQITSKKRHEIQARALGGEFVVRV